MGVPLNVSEWMKGYVGFGATDSEAGFVQGVDANTSFAHEVTIRMDDIDRFVREPAHMATMDGFIYCDKLGGKRPVSCGVFNMLVDDENPLLKFMFYRLPFTDGNGAKRTMLGHKTLHDDHSLDLWGDITTLSVQIFDGDVAGPDMTTPILGPGVPATTPALAVGVLHIQVMDAIRSARSFTSPGSSMEQAAGAVAKFVEFYYGRVRQIYGKLARVAT